MTSFTVLREFFGEPEIMNTAKPIWQMPDYQLLELADRILDGTRDLSYYGLGKATLAPQAERAYVSDILTEEWNRGLVRTDGTALKHLILYCEKILAPDPVIGWAHRLVRQYDLDEEVTDGSGQRLAAIIHRLSAIEKLEESGALQLFPTFDALGADTGRARPRTMGGLGLLDGEEIDLHPSIIWATEASQLVDYIDPDDDPDEVFWNHYDRRRRSTEAYVWECDNLDILYSQERFTIDSDNLEREVDLRFELTWQTVLFLRQLIVVDCARSLGDDLSIRRLDPEYEGDWSEIIRLGLERDGDAIIRRGTSRLNHIAGGGVDLHFNHLQSATNFTSFVSRANVTPVCARTESARLITLASKHLVDRDHWWKNADTPSSLSLPGVSFEVPALSHVSLAEIVALRNNEEIFQEVRGALTNLQEECARFPGRLDWSAYQNEVSQHASEIIAPAHSQLKKRLLKSSVLSTAIGAGTSGLARLCIGGLVSQNE